MKKLNNLLRHRLNHHVLSKSAEAAEIIYSCNNYLKLEFPSVAELAKAYKFSQKIIYISVPNSVLSQEVWGLQQSILAHLNDEFENKVEKIIIKHLTTS